MENIIRAALYIRVSTEEQRDEGVSLRTQTDDLKRYAIDKGYKIVDFYVDDGFSAKTIKRPSLEKLMIDVENNKIDLILFTKLDRWNRRVANYYKLNEILDKHNCKWNAIYENYNTLTTEGILHVNIMLSVAENEQRQISDRILAVFKNKKERGEVCNGSAVLGYKVVNKKMVIDESKSQIIKEMFDFYEMHGNLNKTNQMMRDKYYPNTNIETTSRRLRNKMYIGIYDRGGILNENYCEPLISDEQFYLVQDLLTKNTKAKSVRRLYIFSKLLKCGECGNGFKGAASIKQLGVLTKEYKYYNCHGKYFKKVCSASYNIREEELEKFLLKSINEKIKNVSLEVDIVETVNSEDNINEEILTIKKKMEKLKNLYINDMILLEQYNEDFTRFKTTLNDLNKKKQNKPTKRKNNAVKLKEIVESGIFNNYQTFTNEEKRRIWLSIIDKIEINGKNDYEIYFK